MIGDHPTADIGGAGAMGLNTAWVSRGNLWTEHSFPPTLVVLTAVETLNEIVVRSNLV